MKPKHRTFACKGCGAPAGVLLEGSAVGAAGAVFHSKPLGHLGRVAVQCSLYQQLSARQYGALHEDAPELEQLDHWDQPRP